MIPDRDLWQAALVMVRRYGVEQCWRQRTAPISCRKMAIGRARSSGIAFLIASSASRRRSRPRGTLLTSPVGCEVGQADHRYTSEFAAKAVFFVNYFATVCLDA